MSDYVGIQGQAVINTGTDPSPNVNVQVWYNNATYAFKISNEVAAGAWATGGNLATAKSGLAGAGTQTAGLAFGGFIPPTNSTATEEYDGNSWTTSPASMSTAKREFGGAGTQALALAFGGFSPSTPASTATEEWTGAGSPLTKTITVS